MLDDSGVSGIWLEQNGSNPVWLKLAFEKNVKGQWITECNAMLLNKSSCRTYISYKDQFVLHSYLVRLSEQVTIDYLLSPVGITAHREKIDFVPNVMRMSWEMNTISCLYVGIKKY